MLAKIEHVRAFPVRGGGADYRDQGEGHRIDDHIATPMSRYREYRRLPQDLGITVLGTLAIEVAADADVRPMHDRRMAFGVERHRAIPRHRPLPTVRICS